MAEVLGVVASAITIGSMAIGVAKSVQTIKDLCTDIQDSEGNVRMILAELETISTILIEIAEESNGQELPIRNSKSLANSLSLCQTGANQLADIVDGLRKSLKRNGYRKKWAGVRLFLQKDKITQFRAQLESAKTTLLLSHQCFL